ncbi:MAG TPA: NfeD family protein [Gallionella sp.]|nr:NfeD family protein [Gallionella sp.]
MEPYILWFLLALALLIAEMASGTFYMLVLAGAMCVGGLAALIGFGEPLQLTFGAIAGVAGIWWLHRWKGARAVQADQANPDFGQPVQVLNWREDGTARVYYRGAEWDAEPETADTPHAGTLYIKAMRGSKLIVSQHKPQ